VAAEDPFGADLATLRRDARERTLALLYEAEMKDVPATAVLDALDVVPDPMVVELVTGITDHVVELDARIDSLLRDDWRPERLPLVDRLVLRLAGYELDHRPGVPTGAVINEAVELAKRFGATDRSHTFVNGVLAAWGRPGARTGGAAG
jgi:transcription antitermination protein NusB